MYSCDVSASQKFCNLIDTFSNDSTMFNEEQQNELKSLKDKLNKGERFNSSEIYLMQKLLPNLN